MEHLRLDLAGGPWWLAVIMIAAAAGLSMITYWNTQPPIQRRLKIVLGALRTIALACLLLMLFEPLLRIIMSSEEVPRIAVVIDNSASMRLQDGAVRRESTTRNVIAGLKEELGNQADVFVFDERVRESSWQAADSVSLKGFRTDIANAIRSVSNSTKRYGALVLVTDGNHNGEESAMRGADRTEIGVYSVGIGDTNAPKDLQIQSVLVAGSAVVSETVPVTVNVLQFNMADGDYEVVVDDNGTTIARNTITVRRGIAKSTTTILWTPTSEGTHKLTARIQPQSGEATTANNVLADFVQVRKNKRRIVLVSGAPSPDVAAIRTILERDPAVTIQTYIQKQGSDFYEGVVPPNAFVDAETIVLIGFPIASSPSEVVERIASAVSRGRSLLFVMAQNTDPNKLKLLESVLPFRISAARANEFQVSPDVTSGGTSDPIMRITGTDGDERTWNNLPPVYRTETFVDPQPGSTTLSTIRVGTAPLNEPLIMKRDAVGAKSLALLGYGVYRWQLLTNGSDVLGTFVNNSVKWLSVTEEDKPVKIRSTHTLYSRGEHVVFNASVRDASRMSVDGAMVTVKVNGPGGLRDIVLSDVGDGRYSIDAGAMPTGDYSYVGTALQNNTILGTDAGRFSVGDMGIEESGITRNVSVLRALAHRSNAMSVEPDSLDVLINALKADPRLQPIVRSSQRERALYQLPWLVAIAIAALSLEWYLRKRRGLT